MHLMSARLKHLIDPAPLHERAAVPEPACCSVADALAGDCRSSIFERLKIVEAACRFGQRCTRDCAQRSAAGFGFAGEAIVRGGQVATAAAGPSADNDHDF